MPKRLAWLAIRCYELVLRKLDNLRGNKPGFKPVKYKLNLICCNILQESSNSIFMINNAVKKLNKKIVLHYFSINLIEIGK